MWQDPIVEETRALRDAYARQFNYDFGALFADVIAKQTLHPELYVSFPPRRSAIYTACDRQQDPHSHRETDPFGAETG